MDATLASFRRRCGFSLVLGGLVSRRRQLGVVDIFFISYTAVMLVWPYYDPRFLVTGNAILDRVHWTVGEVQRPKGNLKHVFEAWALGFAIMGLPVLISSTIVSFSGLSFGDRCYPDRYRATYCAAGYCERGLDSTQSVDPDALQLLQAFK